MGYGANARHINIDQNGLIGIGEEVLTPVHKLDVDGNVSIFVDKGSASWTYAYGIVNKVSGSTYQGGEMGFYKGGSGQYLYLSANRKTATGSQYLSAKNSRLDTNGNWVFQGTLTAPSGNSTQWSSGYNDNIVSATYNNGTDLLTFNKRGGGSFTVLIPTDTTGGSGGGSGIKSIGAGFGITVVSDSTVKADTSGTGLPTRFDLDTTLANAKNYVLAETAKGLKINDTTPTDTTTLSGDKITSLTDVLASDVAANDNRLDSLETTKYKLLATRSAVAGDFHKMGKVLYVNTTTPTYTIPTGLTGIDKYDYVYLSDEGSGTITLVFSAVTLLDASGTALTSPATVQQGMVRYLSSNTYQFIGKKL